MRFGQVGEIRCGKGTVPHLPGPCRALFQHDARLDAFLAGQAGQLVGVDGRLRHARWPRASAAACAASSRREIGRCVRPSGRRKHQGQFSVMRTGRPIDSGLERQPRPAASVRDGRQDARDDDQDGAAHRHPGRDLVPQPASRRRHRRSRTSNRRRPCVRPVPGRSRGSERAARRWRAARPSPATGSCAGASGCQPQARGTADTRVPDQGEVKDGAARAARSGRAAVPWSWPQPRDAAAAEGDEGYRIQPRRRSGIQHQKDPDEARRPRRCARATEPFSPSQRAATRGMKSGELSLSSMAWASGRCAMA